MTRFEKAKVLGFRATQLEQGHHPRIPVFEHDTVFTIAEREFDQGTLGDILVDRVEPDGKITSIHLSDLAWVE